MINFDRQWLLFLPVFVVYVIGMNLDIMEIDAAQYAAMSLDMMRSGKLLEFSYWGEDYIDKPPLLFWVTALSFKIFGVSNFTYRLPSVLFTLLGLFSTYRLGRLLYDEKVGFYSALMLASCQAWFLISHDVRTDTILAASTIFAIWQLAEFSRSGKLLHIVGSALGIAGAMLTKGPIGLAVPALAIGSDFLYKRQWHMFFRWQSLVLLALVLLLLSPMLYGLYIQFDAAGGKQTYNGFITSGLRFYFWTQSFGRITGESTWRDDTDPLFFVHTFLWSFLPWTILALSSFFRTARELCKRKVDPQIPGEVITFGGVVLPFIAFSMSHYKLPHYIYVVFPLIAIQTGKFLKTFLDDSSPRQFGAMKMVHVILSVVICLLGLVVNVYCLDLMNPWILAVWLFLFVGVLYISFYGGTRFAGLILPSFLSMLALNFLMDAYFYRAISPYQTETLASRMAKDSGVPLVGFHTRSYSMDFYYGELVPVEVDLDHIKEVYGKREVWLYTTPEGREVILRSDFPILEDRMLPDFHVSTLSWLFLNPATRLQSLEKRYLLRVKP